MRAEHSVSLPSVWLIVLTALVVPLPAATIENFVLEVPSTPVSVWLGDPVTLPCSVRPPMDIRPLEVRWYRPTHYHNPVLLYKDRKIQTAANEPQYQGRVSLMGLESGVGGLEVGIASLILRNITAADCGEYECYVGSDQWYDTGHISLQLSKLGSVPVLVAQLNDKGERQQVNVTCVSEGWTPKPRLIWRDSEGRELKHLQGPFYTTDSQGLVTVSSWLLFSPSDSEWLSCGVSLSGGDSRESRVALRVPVPFPSPEAVPQSAGWMAAFISLLVLSLLAITVLSVLLIKSNKRGKYTTVSKQAPATEGNNTSVQEQDKHQISSAVSLPESEALLSEGNITTDQNTAWKYKKHAVAENIVLNPETAHMNLKISDLKSVVYGHENINTSSRRFLKHTCVLGDPGFSSGQHYWEVQLEDAEKKEVKKSWSVGVASASAQRGMSFPLVKQNGFWLFSNDETKDCSANTYHSDGVFTGLKLRRLGVFLDCDEHTVSFYNAEKDELLFTHKGLKKDKIHPLFNPGEKDSIPLRILDLK